MKLSLCNFKLPNGGLDPVKVSALGALVSAEAFVETGTYLGDTVDAMLGFFEKVVSIELSPELHSKAQGRFAQKQGVQILLGNSATRIADAAKGLGGRSAIFWLDAHWSGGNTAKADENTPIVKELDSIREFDVGQSIIMVDDLRYFIDVPTGFEVHEANHGYPLLRDLLEKVSALWPDRFVVINGDILFIFPVSIRERIEISPVLAATHKLRSGDVTDAERTELEAVIAGAQGEERDVLLSLPNIFSHSLLYGIGGEYLYWRSLVWEREGALDSARADLELARRCGRAVPMRDWE
ncbi:hypothetical protein ACQKP1_23020 [Allorhizobium sp. NPDC080224]|uniref:hypothetical protein n=1 Tax=Allorhizobium sp. NPDC080224 TaxID=3390547 RepID=UPI003D087673